MPRIRKDNDGEEIAKYKKNPFMNDFAADLAANTGTRVEWIGEDKNKFVITGCVNTGEITGMQRGVILGQSTYVDKKKYVKIYAQGIAAIFNLKKSGQKVFAIIYQEISMHRDTDTVYIPYDKSMGFSRATYYNGIKECITAGLIAQTFSAGLYYINPMYLYNGRRFLLINQYIAAESDADTKTINNPQIAKNGKRGVD